MGRNKRNCMEGIEMQGDRLVKRGTITKNGHTIWIYPQFFQFRRNTAQVQKQERREMPKAVSKFSGSNKSRIEPKKCERAGTSEFLWRTDTIRETSVVAQGCAFSQNISFIQRVILHLLLFLRFRPAITTRSPLLYFYLFLYSLEFDFYHEHWSFL